MKFKRFVLVISVLCFSICSTGCGEALYTMTDDEEAVIALYAAKMVSKFNKNQTTGICNARVKTGELDEAYGEVIDEELPDVEDDLSFEFDPETGEISDSENDSISIEEGFSFSDAIGIDGVDFSCSSFDVTKEFKATSSFILTEIKGKSYLVLYIDGTNTSGNDIDIDNDLSFDLKVDGEKSSTQNTFLSNDLSTFKGTIAAGETIPFVLVFQYKDAAVENITSLSLEVTNDGTTRGATL